MRKERYESSSYRDLVDAAAEASCRAYSPYSHFQVGAALLDSHGKIWQGCNIENASFTPTICGERTALFKAVSEGVHSFQAIAIVGRKEGREELTEDYTPPCGVCRQALTEFCPPDMPVILANRSDELAIYQLSELIPLSFASSNLNRAGSGK